MNEKLMNVSNSHKVRDGNVVATTKKVERPEMRGKVGVKKKSSIVKFAEAFLPEDVTDVRSYILTRVIVPSIKKIIDEVFHVILWGSQDGYSGQSRTHTPRNSYEKYFDKQRSYKSGSARADSGAYILNSDFTFDYVEDAESFVGWMIEMIDENGLIRLSEANEEFGCTGYYTDGHYGWKNLSGWRIIDSHRSEGRWVLKLPRPFPID